MRYFLLVYDRVRGELLEESEFDAEMTALHARFGREVELGFDPGVEVVVLGAESRDALVRTHARYFQSVNELLASS